ncbi:antirestriction protein ArdA [Kiloniella sp.]|uniref:antirestriction protein ArdA n=1 Tax=Kiloniella sp. TaxID=1938587 RepID=UPI003A8CCB35
MITAFCHRIILFKNGYPTLTPCPVFGDHLYYCWDYLQDCGILEQIPEHLRFYFDDEAYARDMDLNGDITEFRADNTDYIVWGVLMY